MSYFVSFFQNCGALNCFISNMNLPLINPLNSRLYFSQWIGSSIARYLIFEWFIGQLVLYDSLCILVHTKAIRSTGFCLSRTGSAPVSYYSTRYFLSEFFFHFLSKQKLGWVAVYPRLVLPVLAAHIPRPLIYYPIQSDHNIYTIK